MTVKSNNETPVDLFIIGGGVNGCGIARDAAGRGLSVTLAEMGDLAQATSSASSKLFHGGLRYLEYFEFGLVRHSLAERETLLRAMPHISWPMRFVLPFHKDMRFDSTTPTSKLLTVFMPWMKGRRPAWLIRLGLFLYDTLGGRKILPSTRRVNLSLEAVGAPLIDKFQKAYEYSDCWVQDARLVALNAVDAKAKGAAILTRTKVISAVRHSDNWDITTENQYDGTQQIHRARTVINAAGPWVADVLGNTLKIKSSESVRLVRGSHIVVPKLFDHEQPYILQGTDGRIVFAIPYEGDFTLIGTTDVDHETDQQSPKCTEAETKYLCDFVSNYFKKPVQPEDVIWSYSGIRPLYDDGASDASAATRDYVLSLSDDDAPLLNVFGGKITTYRVLAEDVLAKLGYKNTWTAGAPLPGGDFPWNAVEDQITQLSTRYPFLSDAWAIRMFRTYGTQAFDLLADAKDTPDLGHIFGATLTEKELTWLWDIEFARTAEDILWRRTKLGLRMSESEQLDVDNWMKARREATL
ncbi:MAG: glycerol-3-phosphate dehydrogenase [Paracoccaceae bacterium]|nr:glycerol-3-phosphate dehydrogenase [Paracoccaceae bacterium]MDG2257214.1 glycerol-3-phosphate dehydrogenase [Paracoccaceae bacterium]